MDATEQPPLPFKPRGAIDETSWQPFAETLTQLVTQARAEGRGVRIDFSDVPHMSSRGLRAITLAWKAVDSKVEIVLAAANPRVREVFAISRYDKIFRVEDALG